MQEASQKLERRIGEPNAAQARHHPDLLDAWVATVVLIH
jgi:hypothetical protein